MHDIKYQLLCTVSHPWYFGLFIWDTILRDEDKSADAKIDPESASDVQC